MNRYKEEERDKYILEAGNIVSIFQNRNLDSFLLGFVLSWLFVKGSPKKYEILRNKLKGWRRTVVLKYYLRQDERDKYNIKNYEFRIMFPSNFSNFKHQNTRVIILCIKNNLLTDEIMK